MPEFIARGTIELQGVDFFITAETIEDARRKAAAGEYDHYEDNGASAMSCEIKVSTVEEN
jgi:hypothetical protein